MHLDLQISMGDYILYIHGYKIDLYCLDDFALINLRFAAVKILMNDGVLRLIIVSL